MLPHPADIGLQTLCLTLDELGIPFFIGGSLASSIHGSFRSTADVDLVAAVDLNQAEALASRLEAGFYLDRDAIRSALRLHRSFNLIHLASSYKFDIFPLTSDPWHQSQLARRIWLPCPLPGAGDFSIPVCSAEDIVLAKLQWFRAGGEVSDRQWQDLTSIIQARSATLDLDYLRHWAAQLRLQTLLDRLLAH